MVMKRIISNNRCPKCGGFIHFDYEDERYCINCGWRDTTKDMLELRELKKHGSILVMDKDIQ